MVGVFNAPAVMFAFVPMIALQLRARGSLAAACPCAVSTLQVGAGFRKNPVFSAFYVVLQRRCGPSYRDWGRRRRPMIVRRTAPAAGAAERVFRPRRIRDARSVMSPRNSGRPGLLT